MSGISGLVRFDGRRRDQVRPVKVTRNFIKHAEGAVLIEMGDTKVICTASVEEKVPPFLKGKGTGWVTAEYAMLPRATHERSPREAVKGKQGGRTLEIQRLVGRALRSVTDMSQLGERSIWIDCDVIQADGGTRTASITGAFIALADACAVLKKKDLVKKTLQTGKRMFFTGEVERPEAVSQPTLRNALAALADHGIIRLDSGKMELVNATPEALKAAESLIVAYLDREVPE